MIDIQKIRKDFPILNQLVYKRPLVYLDNAATTQKPQQVVEAELKMYHELNSNIHRGVHRLSELSTDAYEKARETVRSFINARESKEVIFTSGTTGSVNMLAFSFGEKYVNEGDEILISAMEHHSNIVPWQLMCERKKAVLKVIPMDDDGNLLMDEYEKLLSDKTRLVSVTHVSNTLGTVNPIKEIIDIAHSRNIPVMIDGAQAIQHTKVDVQELDCDFYVFSGHKLYGPTGIGALYGKEKWLQEMPPYQGGGDMVETVTFEKTTYAELPFKFEAGTANYIGAVGMAAGIDYIEEIGIEEIARYEEELLEYATEKLTSIEGLRIYGNAKKKVSVTSFLIGDLHHYDTGMLLDKLGIAVRTGHHCTHPVMNHFGITGTVRASYSFYNTKEEIDRLYEALIQVKEMLS